MKTVEKKIAFVLNFLMKQKIIFILCGVILVSGVYFLSHQKQQIAQKCPDDYATYEEQSAAMSAWADDFYRTHPEAALKEFSAARYKFWVDHKCTAALARYAQAKAGNADPQIMDTIDDATKGSVSASNTFDREKFIDGIKKLK